MLASAARSAGLIRRGVVRGSSASCLGSASPGPGSPGDSGSPGSASSGGGSSAAATTVLSANVSEGRLRLEWGDGHRSEFHGVWLASNCRCPRCLHETGQRTGRGATDDVNVAAEACSVNCGEVTVSWPESTAGASTTTSSSGALHTATFGAAWLRRHCYSPAVLARESAERVAASAAQQAVPEVSYGEVVGSDTGLRRWLRGLNDHGVCLLKGVPLEDGKVGELARRVGPLSHAIYGEVFDVRSEPSPINIAYTPRALPLHMDMAYYESPPGIQFLHCMRFDESIEGGNSTFMDAHGAAEALRARDPEAFETMCRVPATFEKIHAERDHPIRMKYHRPHIATNARGDVTQVFWSPPFEGPLRVPDGDVLPYYAAYAAFQAVLDCPEVWRRHGLRLRLQPGDLVVFNQRRVLHGRDAFTAQGHRHLQGCYVAVDDFLNRYRVLECGGGGGAGLHDGISADFPPGERRSGISSHY